MSGSDQQESYQAWVARHAERIQEIDRTPAGEVHAMRMEQLLIRAPPLPEIAALWQAAGIEFLETGNLPSALSALLTARRIFEATVGLHFHGAWHLLEHLSRCYQALGRLDDSERTSLESLALKTRMWGENAAGLATPLHALAVNALHRGNVELARKRATRALDVLLLVPEAQREHDMITMVLFALAEGEHRAGDPAASIAFLRRAVEAAPKSNEQSRAYLVDRGRQRLAERLREVGTAGEALALEAERRRARGHDALVDLERFQSHLAGELALVGSSADDARRAQELHPESPHWIELSRSPLAVVWQTPSLDGVAAGRCREPALRWLSDVDGWRREVRRLADRQGGGLVEANLRTVRGAPAAVAITKHPRQPHGMSYVGVLLRRDGDHGCLLTTAFTEQGTTGAREAVVMDSFLREGRTLDAVRQGWWRDPYEPAHQGPSLRNAAEDDQFDAMFPGHPLSRARRFLAAIAS